jgi:hypothetical protein
MHSVKQAKYVEDYKIILTFDDKTDNLIDLLLKRLSRMSLQQGWHDFDILSCTMQEESEIH